MLSVSQVLGRIGIAKNSDTDAMQSPAFFLRSENSTRAQKNDHEMKDQINFNKIVNFEDLTDFFNFGNFEH